MNSHIRFLRRAWAFSMRLGSLGGCHQIPERSFHFRSYQFPVCARCTGVLIGQLAAFTALLIGLRVSVCVALMLMLIMFADWMIQYLNIRKSTNLRRAVTGALCGFGYINILFFIISIVVKVKEG